MTYGTGQILLDESKLASARGHLRDLARQHDLLPRDDLRRLEIEERAGRVAFLCLEVEARLAAVSGRGCYPP